MANFNWADTLSGIGNGLDFLNEVDEVFSTATEIGLTKNENPINTVSKVIEKVVESKNEKVGIDNESVIKLLELIAKSTKNDLDDKAIEIIKVLLK